MRCTDSVPSRFTYSMNTCIFHMVLCLHIQKHSCHAPSVPGLPVKCVVAAFNSSSANTARVEKLHRFLNNLIQIQLLQFFGGMLSKFSWSGTYNL